MNETGYQNDDLLNLLRSQLFGTARARELTAEQKRLITQFRLVRNGLGNYGGHGDVIDNALLPAPTIESAGMKWTLTFAARLPAHARWVWLWYPASHGPERDHYDATEVLDGKLTINRPGAALVEIADLREDVIAAGVPINVSHGYQEFEISPEPVGSET